MALRDELDAGRARRVVGSERIGGYKYPREVHVVDALPLTPVGKIDRKALRARLHEKVESMTTTLTLEELAHAEELDLGTSDWTTIDAAADRASSPRRRTTISGSTSTPSMAAQGPVRHNGRARLPASSRCSRSCSRRC